MLSVFILTGANSAVVSHAETNGNAFDNTTIERDLGNNFDYALYPFNALGTVKLYALTEYAYSDNNLMQDNYALYLYIYNPQALDLSTAPNANKVNIAVTYNAAGDPSEFANVKLTYLSKTTGDKDKLFYKFKIDDSDGKFLKMATNYSATHGKRRYDIVGLQLLEKGELTAIDYNVSDTYEFTGYSAGYGTNADTLSGKKFEDKFETVELNVNHTFYRTQSSSLGEGHQNQLDTVYFRVPNRLLDYYGSLQRIKAEWYEFKTKEIVVTQNQDFYNAVLPYLGVDCTEQNKGIGYGLALNYINASGLVAAPTADAVWNMPNNVVVPITRIIDALYYLFPTENISDYDPYAVVTEQGGITGNALYDYILNYTDSNVSPEYLHIKDGQTLHADLFEDAIDESRKIDNEHGKIQQGYSYYDFDADVDLQTLKTWQDGNPSWWDSLLEYGIFGDVPEDIGTTVSPIQLIDDSTMLDGTGEQVAERLLINPYDVNTLRAEYTAASLADETVVLFRFANSDYYSEMIDIVSLGTGLLGTDEFIENEAYVAQQSVFFDFDVIQLTFKKDDVETAVGVIADPIDIVNPVTPPVNTGCTMSDIKNTLSIILFALAGIVVIWLVVKIIGIIKNLNNNRKLNKVYKATQPKKTKRKRK
ncbi:MAG: hypothetical protein J6B04_05485 [Clostridia bacterium]|nr:hypothetical protein [Clostridia bacterium]